MESLTKATLEQLIKNVVVEVLNNEQLLESEKTVDPSGVISVRVPKVKVTEEDRLDTGKENDIVYTKDLFTLEESPRLGCGVMEMDHTTFDWTLNYDEIDYVIDGELSIHIDGRSVTAKAGEIIYIPKGSSIQFSVAEKARFLYVTYPADWANQG